MDTESSVDEEEIKDLPTLDFGIKYVDLNYYLVLKNHPELMNLLCWLVEQIGSAKKVRRLFLANPLIESLRKLVRGYLESELHFFQFQILHHSGFVEDVDKLEALFEDSEKIGKIQKKLEKASADVTEILRNVEKLMDFVIFQNYTQNEEIVSDFANVANMLQRNKLIEFQFTANLRNISVHRESILLIDSEIFQKQFNLQLARARFDQILQLMFGAEDSRETDNSDVLDFLLHVSARAKSDSEAPDKVDKKLSLENFWKMMGKTLESFRRDLQSMSKKSEGSLSMAEIEYMMRNVDKVKEVDIARKLKVVKMRVVTAAFKNFFVVRNLTRIFTFLEEFVKKMQFDFNNDLGALKEIAEKAQKKDSNFFELVNLSLKVDPRIRRFCEGDSIMFQFIESNLTKWKGDPNQTNSITWSATSS